MPTVLEQSLFKTLAYFAYFSFPLTSFELWKWSDIPHVSLFEVETTLRSSSWLADRGTQSFESFFGLGDVGSWKEERLCCVTDALRKHRKARRFAACASMLPWVNMVAVCNSLAFSFTNEESDIDFFIVTRRGGIWSTRLILTSVLALFRLRPGEGKRDPLCLSFFVADDRLDLSSVKIGPDDPYLTMWIATLSPVFDREDTFARVCSANGWIRSSLPRAKPVRRALAFAAPTTVRLSIAPFFERFAERIQRKKFPRSLRSIMNTDTRVVVTDGMLKFHQDDRRRDILLAYETLVSQLDNVSFVDRGLSAPVANTVDV